MTFFPTASSELSGIIPVLLGDIATIVCKTHSSVVAVYPSLDGQMIPGPQVRARGNQCLSFNWQHKL